MAAPRPATSISKNTPPSSRVNYGDHYLLSAILSEINKRGGVTSVDSELQKQNKRGIIERTGFDIGVYQKQK
jgi:hypothetical protein